MYLLTVGSWENASLKVDESALTGESLGVDKTEDPIEGEVPLGDRTNIGVLGKFCLLRTGLFSCNLHRYGD